jgi:phenylpropionate dioxygenase-like ring-hydroxylating dioxygenase large terminal subunit
MVQSIISQATQLPLSTQSASSPADQPKSSGQYYGTSFVDNMWYYAVPADSLRHGKVLKKTMLGQPILLGRDAQGTAFALRDICPHQAVPLSAGTFDGYNVMCPFHGWKFDTNGVCTEIPSLCSDQKINFASIKTGNYIVREVQDSIWVYFGNKTEDLPAVPTAPGLDGFTYGKTTTTLQLPTHIDFAVAALIDTAHVPYVHKSWWWRSAKNVREKSKTYVPDDNGWTMLRHSPSKHTMIFKLIGQYLQTEISFRLPGLRREYLTFNDRTIISGISCLTPIDDTHTELNHTTYWTIPWVSPIVRPFVNYFVAEFLGQDRSMALMQEQSLKHKPDLIMTIKDAGTPGNWYFQCKREWNDAYAENRPFRNPIKEKVLRWKT